MKFSIERKVNVLLGVALVLGLLLGAMLIYQRLPAMVIGGFAIFVAVVVGTLISLRRDWSRQRRGEEELLRANEALQASASQAADIVAVARDGLLTIDEQHRIVRVNAAAEEMFRRKAADLIGRPLEQLLPERLRPGQGEVLRAFGYTGEACQSSKRLSRIRGLRGFG